MIPNSITEEEFRYLCVPDETLKSSYDEFVETVEDVLAIMKIGDDVEIVVPIIGRICERVDQRNDYFLYFHSDETGIMHMSHEKELALWIYWICKYKPIRFNSLSVEKSFFCEYGCTINEAVAAYMIAGIVCANNNSKIDYFTDDVMLDLFYDLANRDFSKEAIIARISDLAA